MWFTFSALHADNKNYNQNKKKLENKLFFESEKMLLGEGCDFLEVEQDLERWWDFIIFEIKILRRRHLGLCSVLTNYFQLYLKCHCFYSSEKVRRRSAAQREGARIRNDGSRGCCDANCFDFVRLVMLFAGFLSLAFSICFVYTLHRILQIEWQHFLLFSYFIFSAAAAAASLFFHIFSFVRRALCI